MSEFFEMLSAILAAAAVVTSPLSIGHAKHAYEHRMRARRVENAKKGMSEVEKKPFDHYFCWYCGCENDHVSFGETPALAPEITGVTVKPLSFSDKAQQVILNTPQGQRVRFIPKEDNEVHLATTRAAVKFDLRPTRYQIFDPKAQPATQDKTSETNAVPAAATESKVSQQQAWFYTDAPMSVLRQMLQNTRG